MLPKENTQWPPEVEIGSWYDRLDEWEVWFAGDHGALETFYKERAYNSQNARRFWAGVTQDDQRAIHLPVAADVAATSSNLLFAESPILEPADEGDGADRVVDEILPQNRFEAFILEAAEMSAALGGVYLKVDVDPELSPTPILVSMKPAAVVPVFRRGRLAEVTFWRVIRKKEGTSWFLFEERKNPTGTKLEIAYRLYQGSEGSVGKVVDMSEIDETREQGYKDVGLDMPGLGVVYVPNVLPNRLLPGNPQGMSDYGSCTTLMDALDEAWTSWMRDIRQGLGKLLVDKEFFSNVDAGEFGHFQNVFVKLNLGDLRLGAGDKYEPIKQVQFELRTADHKTTCTQLFSEIVDRSGYNPQTFGINIEGTAQSGTALRIRERKSMMTRQKKSRYWRWALVQLIETVQWMDNAAGLTPSRYEPTAFNVELQDSVTPDPKEVSETILNLRNASALSQETAIRLANPDWSEDQILEEMIRLADESGMLNTEPIVPGEEEGGEDEGGSKGDPEPGDDEDE